MQGRTGQGAGRRRSTATCRRRSSLPVLNLFLFLVDSFIVFRFLRDDDRGLIRCQLLELLLLILSTLHSLVHCPLLIAPAFVVVGLIGLSYNKNDDDDGGEEEEEATTLFIEERDSSLRSFSLSLAVRIQKSLGA